MAQTAGARQNPEAALQRHLQQLKLATPQQKQLTVRALCRGVAAKDPAWVDVLVQVVGSAPRAIQQQLAAKPGLLKDLAGYLANSNTTSSNTAGAAQQLPAAHPSVVRSDTTSSSSPSQCPPAGNNVEQQQQQKAGSSSHAAHTTPSSSRATIATAAGALAHLLDCCEAGVPPAYQELAPALHAALQQRLVCLPALAQATLDHHSSHMVTDQQLLLAVLEAADQGQGPASAVLAFLGPLVLHVLGRNHPIRTLVHDRVTALLAGGTAAGGSFLAAVLLQQGTLLEASGMVEAAWSGLLAACCEVGTSTSGTITTTTSSSSSSSGDTTNSNSSVPHKEFACLLDPPPAHAVLLQYLRGVVGVVQHLATHVDLANHTELMGPTGPMAPALAQALSLLLQSLRLPGPVKYTHARRPYHDAAWAALLALSECPGAAPLVAALFQHQLGLLQALAASWDQLDSIWYCEEPAEHAARLAAVLLLSGTIPDQEERQQQQRLLQAAVNVWKRLSVCFWQGRANQLMELIRLPQGCRALVGAPWLLAPIMSNRLLRPEHQTEGWALLLATPGFVRGLVEGVDMYDMDWLSIVEAVLRGGAPAHIQALLAIPGFGDALSCCCYRDYSCGAVDCFLGDALGSQVLQAYLAQQPALLEALLARLRQDRGHGEYFWSCLACDDSGDGWLLQQPTLLDGVVAALAVADTDDDTFDVVERLLELAPTLVCQALLQPPPEGDKWYQDPSVLEEMLLALVQRRWQLLPGDVPSGGVQLMLLQTLACSELAPRALALLPGLLAQGDAELAVGVFEAMHIIQRGMGQGCLCWAGQLAATSSRGAAVLFAEGQLAALRQGVKEVQQATAAAAAAMRQLQEQHKAMVEALVQPAQDHLPGGSQGSNRQVNSRGGQGGQQPGAEPQQVGGSGQRESKRIAAAGLVGTGTKQGAGGRLVPGEVSPAPAAAPIPGGSGVQVGGAPPAPKRTRR